VGYGLRQGEEETIQAFVDFGGKARAREIAAAKKLGRSRDEMGSSAQEPRLSEEEKAKARGESAARKKLRAAEVQAAKQQREGVRKEQEARRRAISQTLTELSSAQRRSNR
jgi:hypothetical protein